MLADIRRHLTQESGLSRSERDQITIEIADDILGHGPIERLLADDTVSEIMVNGPYDVWIERQGKLIQTSVRFQDDSHLRRILNKIVAQVGRRVDESSAMVDARLPDGSRSTRSSRRSRSSGPLVTIRKFARNRLDFQDLIRLGTLTTETMEFLERCVAAELNILISGGTGTGKTTLLNVLSEAIPDTDRIVTIEDSAELSLHQRHILRLESRPREHRGRGRGLDPRPRPQQPAHAPRPDHHRRGSRRRGARHAPGDEHGPRRLALDRPRERARATRSAALETMVMMSGFEIPLRAVRQQVSAALDLIVQIERLEDGTRQITSITEVQRMESDVITLQELFTYKIEQVTGERVFIGNLVSTGLRPTFLNKFEKRGIALPAGLFHETGPPHYGAAAQPQ